MANDLPRFRPVPLELNDDPMPLHRWDDGSVRIGNTGVKIETVLNAFKRGHTPQWIVESFETLELADVYDVIAFYLRHRSVVDEYLAEIERQAREFRSAIESQPDHKELMARLDQRMQDVRQREHVAPSR